MSTFGPVPVTGNSFYSHFYGWSARLSQASRDGSQLLTNGGPFSRGSAESWSRDGGLNWSDAPSANMALAPGGAWFYLRGDRVIREIGNEQHQFTLPGLGSDASMAFSSDLDGWVIDPQALWRTTDGGNNWSRSEHGAPVVGKPWLRATGGQVLWLSSSERSGPTSRSVYRSDDGGKVWRRVAPPGEFEPDFFANREAVSPVTSDVAFSVRGTGGTLCRSVVFTTDGGLTWTESQMPTSISGCYGWIQAHPRQGITMAQTMGSVPQTHAVSDQGSRWTRLFGHSDSEVSEYTIFEPLAFRDARQWFGGDAMTRDGGRTWQKRDWFPGASGVGLHFGSGNRVWASLGLTAAAVARSTDGGQSWVTVDLSGPDGFKPTYTDRLWFLDDQTGWALARSPARQGLWRTLDAGLSWSHVGGPPEGVRFVGLRFTTASAGFAVGDDGRLYQSANGGGSWRAVDAVDSRSRLTQVYFRTPDQGFALGDEWLWRTTDGGLTWRATELPTDPAATPAQWFEARHLRDIQFGSDRVGWIVGRHGVVLHSRDGGASWQRHAAKISTALSFRSVFAIDDQTVILVDEQGRALTTVTGGQ